MIRSAEKSQRSSKAIALLLPMLMLSACSSPDDALNEKVTAAEEAAAKATAAQQAAEKAAAAALANRPAAAPAVMAEPPNPWLTEDENAEDSGDGDSGSADDGPSLTMGGEGQTVSSDGVVIPGRGV